MNAEELRQRYSAGERDFSGIDIRGECLKTLRAFWLYEGMNITGTTGLTEATIATLKAFGALYKHERQLTQPSVNRDQAIALDFNSGIFNYELRIIRSLVKSRTYALTQELSIYVSLNGYNPESADNVTL